MVITNIGDDNKNIPGCKLIKSRQLLSISWQKIDHTLLHNNTLTVSYHVTSTLPFAWPTAIKFSGSELGYHATHCYKGINGHHNYYENIYSNKCSNFRFLPVYKQRFKLLRPWRFCQKTRFEASQAVFWSLLCYEELKLTIKPFTGSTLPRLLIERSSLCTS